MTGAGQFAILASHVFDGEAVHENAAVLIDGGRISAFMPAERLPKGVQRKELSDGTWLAPGFIDIQVNGGGDVLFNDDPAPETIRTMLRAHRRFGTTSMLPTLISDEEDKMHRATQAVAETMKTEPGVLGIHFEGPFLSPERPGVHDPRMLRAPRDGDVALLASLRGGKTLVTLAPECVPVGFIAELCGLGCVVSLGHSAATYEQTRAAMAEGLTGFTHLFNAMPPPMAREPGPVGAALESADACYSLIVDGVHVASSMLRMALRGAGKPLLITDAMPPVGGMKSSFFLHGNEIAVAGGRCARIDGTLAGAALDMASAVRNCVSLLDLPLTTALALASRSPAEFLGNILGRIAPGYRADLVAFEPDSMHVLETWVAGKSR